RKAEIAVLHEGLRLRLQDAVAAGRAEREHGRPVACRDRRRHADRQFGAGYGALRALRVDVGPVEEIVERDTGAGHDDAGAIGAAEALRDADEIALRVADRERGRVAGVLAGSGRLHPLLGRPPDGAAVTHARAQLLDMFVAQETRELLRRRIVAVD